MGKKDGLAIINMNESNLPEPEHYSWEDLRETVSQYADALRSSDINKGDVVARKSSNLRNLKCS